jgi:hypothetical protein
VEEERVEPSLALGDGVDHDERDGVAEEDRPFDDGEGHVEADQHEESDCYEIGVLFFEEVEEFIEENAGVAVFVGVEELRKQAK